jgi:hypothetical protein
MVKQFLSVATLTAILSIAPLTVTAGHHESLTPPAKAGQVVVTYRGECPPEAVDDAIAKIKETISYERTNSPIFYVSSPGVWADGTVGAVDIHESRERMDQAFAWQSEDATWSTSYDSIAASCGITVDDFEVSVFEAR